MRTTALLLLALPLLASAPLSGRTGDGDPFADCEARLAARPDSWESVCYLHTARTHRLWKEARSRLTALLAQGAENPRLRFTLGLVEIDRGRLPEAAEHIRVAGETFNDRGDDRNAIVAWINLADCRLRQGLLEESAKTLQWAEEATERVDDPALQVAVKVRQTKVLRRQGGDLELGHRVLAALERELPEDVGYHVWKDLLLEYAILLQRLGRYDEARRRSERHAQMARNAGDSYEEATALLSRALNIVGQPPRAGVREQAVQSAREALEKAEQAGNHPAAISALRLLGKLLPGTEGRSHLEECVRRIAVADDSNQRAACLFALAGSLAVEDGQQARGLLRQALALASASAEPWTMAYGWAERYRVNWATLPRQEAAADSLAFLDHIETLRRLQSSETSRAAFFTDWVEVYYSLAGFLLLNPDDRSPEEVSTAFTVAERLRSRVLLDSLAAARVETPPRDEPQAEKRTAVLREIVRVQRRLLDPTLTETERRDLVDQLEDLEHQLAVPVEPALANALPEQEFVELAKVEAALAPDQALLAFLLAPDEDNYGKFAGGSWLMAVTGAGSRAYRLPGRVDLETRVEMFVSLVQAGDEDLAPWEPGAVTLYDDLLAPAVADLPGTVEALILIPDGVLHLLPFGLLRPHPQADPLTLRYRLSSAPSATLWHRWRQASSAADPAVGPPATAALALADPTFLGASAIDSHTVSTTGTLEAEARSWALESGRRLGRLPYAETEGRTLVRRLGGPPSRLLVGEAASEAFLKSAPLADYGVLHFAAHALVDEEHPRRSAVLLAAGGAEEDGLLQPREIAALDLAGKLVVVSTCDSGSGQVLLGEGVQSLARAFFRAGARAVVASLWRLDDDEAAAFFDLFYRALARGESVAGAVAAAQRQLHAAGAPVTAWAGVVVLGDGDLVPLPEGVPRSSWWLLLLPPGLLLLALVLRFVRGDASKAGRRGRQSH